MKTVTNDTKTHYLQQAETMLNPNWIKNMDEGDLVIMNFGNGVTKHYVVEIVKQLKEL